MPHVRNWIAAHGDSWLENLISEYKILAAHDILNDSPIVSLKYNAIESPMHEPIVQECRGLVVLGTDRNAKIAAHPYNKFFNQGEGRAATIDWSTARLQAKLDGSLAILYDTLSFSAKHYTPRTTGWQFASSGSPLGGGRYHTTEKTFGQMFWEIFFETKMRLPPLWRGFTFCFELIAPDNRIVVHYDRPQLILHGARNLITEQEMTRKELEEISSMFQWPLVEEFSVASLEEAIQLAEKLDPIKQEGFVVVDGSFNRIKIKSPKYVVLHHLKDKFTPRGAWHLWKIGEVDEVLAHFPEMTEMVMEVVSRLETAAMKAFEDYSIHRSKPTRKEFALAVKDKVYAPLCFGLLGLTEPTVRDAYGLLRNANDSLAEKLLGL